jgi:hypothetical protein
VSTPVVNASRGLADGCSVVIGVMKGADEREPPLVEVDEADLTGLSGMIELSASRSLAVKLRPRCSRLGRAAFCCEAREEPRRRSGGAVTGEAGVRTIAEGKEGRSVIVESLDELEAELMELVSSDIDLDRRLSGVVLALFCRLVDSRIARPTSPAS